MTDVFIIHSNVGKPRPKKLNLKICFEKYLESEEERRLDKFIRSVKNLSPPPKKEEISDLVHTAIIEHKSEVVEFLLDEYGLNVNEIQDNSNGFTFIYTAILARDIDSCKILVLRGADLSHRPKLSTAPTPYEMIEEWIEDWEDAHPDHVHLVQKIIELDMALMQKEPAE